MTSKSKAAAKKTVKKTKKQETTLVSFLLDRTGSMGSIANDVIGGFNAFIEGQAKEPGECKFVFTLFDSQSVDVEEFESVKDVPALTAETYVPRAMTNLLDAIGETIVHIQDMKKLPKRVLFVIYTDGYENASREYSRQAIKTLVEKKTEQGWDFIFLGADMDAIGEAGSFGVAASSTFGVTGGSNPHGAAGVAGPAGPRGMSTSLNATVSSYRAGDENYTATLDSMTKEQAAFDAKLDSIAKLDKDAKKNKGKK